MRDKENRRELRGKLIRAGNMEEVRGIVLLRLRAILR